MNEGQREKFDANEIRRNLRKRCACGVTLNPQNFSGMVKQNGYVFPVCDGCAMSNNMTDPNKLTTR